MQNTSEALLHFSRAPLKHPMSKFLLRFLAERHDLATRITFVQSREFLTNTMLISELGSPRIGFELELGAHQKEEVSIVNGRLVRQTHRDRSLCINEPMDAIEPLKKFKGRLYVVFSFAGPTPAWYEKIVEPNPALPMRSDAQESIETMIAEIVREQVDLALLAILMKERLDEALKERDKDSFEHTAPLYREITHRCLWEF